MLTWCISFKKFEYNYYRLSKQQQTWCRVVLQVDNGSWFLGNVGKWFVCVLCVLGLSRTSQLISALQHVKKPSFCLILQKAIHNISIQFQLWGPLNSPNEFICLDSRVTDWCILLLAQCMLGQAPGFMVLQCGGPVDATGLLTKKMGIYISKSLWQPLHNYYILLDLGINAFSFMRLLFSHVGLCECFTSLLPLLFI